MEEFRRAGVEIEFLNRPISGTAEDDLLLQIQGVVADTEGLAQDTSKIP